MRYEDIRAHVQAHFRELLSSFKERVARERPLQGLDLEALRNGKALAENGAEELAEAFYHGDGEQLIATFCKRSEITEPLSENLKQRLMEELHRTYLKCTNAALEHNASFDEIDIEPATPKAVSSLP